MFFYKLKWAALLLAASSWIVAGCSSQDDPGVAWILALASGDTTAETPETITGDFDLDVSVDTEGTEAFLFDTTTDIKVNITVVNGVDPDPATGARVRIYNTNDTSQMVYFSAIVDEQGNVSGTFTANTTTNVVTIEVTYQDTTLTKDFTILYANYISGRIILQGTLSDFIPVIVDSDGDGVADSDDAYPDDPDRATTIKYPESADYFTIAYEDLYPVPGDADFNDANYRFSFEEDLNASAAVSRIRAHAVHVAKGAGYNHTLQLAVPGAPAMSYHLVRKDENGNVMLDTTGNLAAGEALEVLPNTSTTITQSNTSKSTSGTLVTGWTADVEFILDTPTSTSTVERIPYDTYIHVINTHKDVHFPGLYSKADASDEYMDSNGFPWALMIPQDWHWPLETKNIHNAYPQFEGWYTSAGHENQDWYLTADENYIYSY